MNTTVKPEHFSSWASSMAPSTVWAYIRIFNTAARIHVHVVMYVSLQVQSSKLAHFPLKGTLSLAQSAFIEECMCTLIGGRTNCHPCSSLCRYASLRFMEYQKRKDEFYAL